MRREIIIYGLLISLIFIFLFFGIFIFNIATKQTDKIIRLSGFIISGLSFIGCAISVFLMNDYSKKPYFSRFRIDKEKEKYLRKNVNYLIFSMCILMLLSLLILVGVMFFAEVENYWNLIQVLIAITVSVSIGYIPILEDFRKFLYRTSWQPLFYFAIGLVVLIIILFGFYTT